MNIDVAELRIDITMTTAMFLLIDKKANELGYKADKRHIAMEL